MKSKTLVLSLVAAITLSTLIMSFRSASQAPTQYMHINVLESTIGGGVGRSRIIVTDASGNEKNQLKIKNYYSAMGLNFKNIAKNDQALIVLLNQLAKEGWEVASTTSSVVASGGRNGGIFATKYLLKK